MYFSTIILRLYDKLWLCNARFVFICWAKKNWISLWFASLKFDLFIYLVIIFKNNPKTLQPFYVLNLNVSWKFQHKEFRDTRELALDCWLYWPKQAKIVFQVSLTTLTLSNSLLEFAMRTFWDGVVYIDWKIVWKIVWAKRFIRKMYVVLLLNADLLDNFCKRLG